MSRHRSLWAKLNSVYEDRFPHDPCGRATWRPAGRVIGLANDATRLPVPNKPRCSVRRFDQTLALA